MTNEEVSAMELLHNKFVYCFIADEGGLILKTLKIFLFRGRRKGANDMIYSCTVDQCFSTAGPRPGTGPWHQLYRAARDLRKLQYATRFH